MKCKYKYKYIQNGKEIEATFDSYQDAIDAAIMFGKEKVSGIFFSSSDNAAMFRSFIEQESEKSKQMKGKFVSTSYIINDIINDGKTPEFTGINAVKGSFQQKFGNSLHKCLQLTAKIKYADIGQDIKKLENELEQEKEKLVDHIYTFQDSKQFQALSKEDQESFKKQISIVEYSKEVILTSINKVIEDVKQQTMGTVYAFPELELKTRDLSAEFFQKYTELKGEKIEGLSAVLDLMSIVKIDNKLTVLITDYKTKISSGGMKDGHALQLGLYKEILKSIGVDLPIRQEIIEFSYTNDSENLIQVKSVKQTLSAQASAESKIKSLFKGININIEKIKEIQDKSNAVLNDLYSNRSIKKWNVEDFIEYLSSRKTWTIPKSTKKLIKSVDKANNKIIFTDDSIENLQEFAEKEIEAGNKIKSAKIVGLIERLQDSKIDPDRIKKIVERRGVTVDRFYKNLQKYTMGDWTYVSHPGLEENGIITMQNKLDNTFDFIVLSSGNNDFNNAQRLQLGQNLLGDIISDVELKKSKKVIPENSMANIIRMKTLALINLFADTFDSKIRISEIKIIDPYDGHQATSRNLNDFQQALKVAKELKAEKVVISNKISFESDEIRLFKFISDFAKKYNIEIDNELSGKSYPVQIAELEKIRDQIEKDYPSEINPNRSSGEIISEIGELHAWIGSLIATLTGYDVNKQHHSSKYSFDKKNSFGAAWSLLRRGEIQRFAENGYVLTGLVQGMDMSVTYANPDVAVDAISRQHRNAMMRSRRDLEAQGIEINKATTEFLNASTSKLSQAIIGYNKTAYSCLFQTKDGKIDNNMRLKNPNDPSLAPFQKDYLEIMLWTFNKYRMPSSVISDSDRNKTFSEFKNSEGYQKYLLELTENDKWLNYPLRKAKNASIIMGKFGSERAIKQTWSDMIDNFQKLVDPRNMFDEQKKKQQELEESLTMFNQYSESDDDRAELLEKRGPEHFEFNMNIVALDYIFSNIKEKYYNEALKINDYVIGTIRLLELQTGEDYSNTIDAINDRIKVDLHGKHLSDPDLSEPTKVITTLRAVGSVVKIGARPILFAKEMTSSLLKIIAKSSLGYFQNENLSAKEILLAYQKVFGNSLEHMGKKALSQSDLGDFSLVGALNRIYGIANFDMNIVPEKFASDRYGIYNVTKQLLYTTSTAPDFYNRMAIFVACMIKDGCYNAHKIESDGSVTYDMNEDDRFSEFWKNKEIKGYKSEKFNEQYALYEWTARQFNSEGYNLRIGELDPSTGKLIFDPLPTAYTNLQRDSMKESIGTVLGMYDHEESETSRHKTFSIYFRQFQTYMSGEIKKYFATGNQTTSIGRPELKRDDDGNIIYIEGYDEYGEIIPTINNKNGDLKPIYEWTGHPVEGLVVSFLGTIHDLFSGDLKEGIKNGDFAAKQRLANCKVFLFNLLIAYLFAKLLALIWGGGDEDNIPDELAPAYILMRDRVSQEFSPWQSIAEPILGLNIVGLNYAQDFAKDLSKVITRDDYNILNVMYDNISAFKDTGYMDDK